MDISPESLAIYRKNAETRWQNKQKKLEQRRKQAWIVAKEASEMLKGKYHAKKVLIFGSLVHNYWFSETSDIDLAAWGIDSHAYFEAVGDLQGVSYDFQIDLIYGESAKNDLLSAILEQGKQI